MSGGKRPGRPWSPPKGPCQEINDLVDIVRSWLDGAGITVRGLHSALTQDHFADGTVPDERKLRDRLAGVGLTWDTVEAVADICFSHESQAATGQRLDRPRALWKAAAERPTVLGADGEPAVPARDLLQAQERAIGALEELNRVRKAYEASERARNQSLQVATVLFALLGQAQAQIAGLSRRLDALQAAPDALSHEISSTHLRLMRATSQEDDLRTQLSRAEAERERAQALVDMAARRIQLLESELKGLSGVSAAGVSGGGSGALALPGAPGGRVDADSELDQVDAALQTAREVLDREHEAVTEIAAELGAQATPPDVGTVPVRVVRMPDSDGESEEGLFGTTLNNHRADGAGIVLRRDDRMLFVGAATRRISRGIDLDEIVLGLCRATVPVFADTILVYLRDPLPIGDERPVGPLVMRLRRVEGPPSELATWASASDFPVAEPVSQTVQPAEGCLVPADASLTHVLRGVRPVFADHVARTALHELLGENYDVPDEFRAILAPLRGRRRVVGAVVFLRNRERARFDPEDLQVGAQLTTQTALGIDKALLYGRHAYVADELQRTMLPPSLPRSPGVRLASHYLPAAETARVGGDWYDAIPLSASRVALVVGDVMGHSMTSAAIMGQLQTTVQTLAALDLPPQELMRHLDEQAQRLGSDRLATCMYAVYDPIAHRVTICNAGHPPPILIQPNGQADILKVPPGVPIGVGGVDFEAVEHGAPAGSTLVLYTDGLVEARRKDVWTGIQQLRERLAETARHTGTDHLPPVETLCDDALDVLGPGDRDDDVAILAARFEGITASDVAQWSIKNTTKAPRESRKLTRQALERWGLDHLVHTAELLVSELVTNAVNATPTIREPIEVRLLRTQVLRFEIQDRSTDMPRWDYSRELVEDGRGLRVVGRLAERWGVSLLLGGKVVWFEIGLEEPGPLG